MAKKLLMLFSCMLVAMYTFAMPFYTRKEIKLHVEKKIEHRSATLSYPLQTFVNGSQLEIKVNSPIKNLTVSITNAINGEVIHYQIDSHIQTAMIDLYNSEPNAQYIIAFYAANSLIYTGEFTLN
ncbi:DUF3244 domain-containing protein [Bacteroides sp.]|uniref:DUF3244 domain-containing protein n=1 Tax=Bacteroides sp. TaxID=29523 RepID=UPI002FCC2DEE